mmetsp:Transcript_19479/g.40112  ORF Transcript_19479/g.40112 Transcript_19479/m.40112 type:complete len:372 (-) Transcript_19479:39-1154(-)
MLHQVNDTSRVTVFVIVPGNKLDEVRVEHDTGIGIEDGRAEVTFEISGDKRLVRVSKESLLASFGVGLDVGADFFVGGGLLNSAGQVNNGDIDGRNTESHTGDLSDKGRNDLGDGNSGSGGGGDDVTRGGTSSTPVLAGRRVNNGLGGGHGVDSGHEGFLNLELVVDGLNHRGKSVGGARGARDEILRSVVVSLVDTHDNGLRVILGRGGVDDLLGSSIKDGLGLFLGEEDSGGLADVVGSEGTPADLLGVTASGSLDLLSVKDKEVSVNLDGLLGFSVDGIVLVLVRHVFRGGRSGVDGLKIASIIFHDDTGHKTSNTSESVDSHTGGGHGHGGIVVGGLEGKSREGASGKGRNGADGGDDGDSRELHFD